MRDSVILRSHAILHNAKEIALLMTQNEIEKQFL